MSNPADIPDAVLKDWRALLATDKKTAADDLYFAEILPLVLRRIDTNPAHLAIRERKYNILVSLMVHEPETSIIAAHVVQPERLLVVSSKAAERVFNRAHSVLSRQLLPSRIHHETVNPKDPTEIYATVKGFIEKHSGESPRHILDMTGGIMIMNATAGQVAWELDMPLFFIDRWYDAVIRRGRPGTEKVLLFRNPSEQRARNARQHALGVYRSGNFTRAADAFVESSKLNADARAEKFALTLCNVYAAWADLDFPALTERLNQLVEVRKQPTIAEYLTHTRVDRVALDCQVAALRAVTDQRPLARMASYLELAAYRDSHRHDFACLLVYRCMEALVEYGLHRAGGGIFDRSRPDYTLLGNPVELTARYTALARKTEGGEKGHDQLPFRVGLVQGVTLLCLVANLHNKSPNPMQAENYVGRIIGVANLRNKSVLAHGDRTLTLNDCDTIIDRTHELAQKLLQTTEYEELMSCQRHLKPLALQ